MGTKAIDAAIRGIQPMIAELVQLGASCVQQVIEAKGGTVIERWMLPNGTSVVVYGTPVWRDAFLPAPSPTNAWSETIAAIRAAAQATAS
jgi:hypothetical protein